MFSEVLAPPAVWEEFGRPLPWVTFRPSKAVTLERTQGIELLDVGRRE